MALQGGGGGHHHGGHGGFPYGMYPPWYTQVGYPVAYQFQVQGTNRCPDTYCPVHDDQCECYCKYRRPLAEGKGGGSLAGLGAPPDYPAYAFKSVHGVPLPADVWWANRCQGTHCVKHNDMCSCECPLRSSTGGIKPTGAWNVEDLLGDVRDGLGAISTFDKLLGGFALVTIGAAFALPYVKKLLKKKG